MTFLNIIKFLLIIIAFLYSIFLFYGMIVIYQILVNNTKMSIITNTENESVKHQDYITIETKKKKVVIGKITIISLIIIACSILLCLSYYNIQIIHTFLQFIFAMLR